MSNNEKQVWTSIKMYIRPEPMTAGCFFGRYSRATFIVTCQICGFHMLVSKKAAQYLIENGQDIICPSCEKASFQFSNKPFSSNIQSGKNLRKWYLEKRWPWYFQCLPSGNNLPPIDPHLMISALFDDNEHCPKVMPILCLKDQRFPTDAETTLDVMVPPIGVAKAISKRIYKAFTSQSDHLVFRFRGENDEIHEIR